MDNCKEKELKIAACKVRIGIINAIYHAKSGHPGGSLSSADILTYLYFAEMNINPLNPAMPERDRFVLSKGHCAPGLYSVLALKGYFNKDELSKLRQIGAMLQGHPDMNGTPGIDMSTGSLGQGVSAACGMAKAAKIDGNSFRVYTLLGDGECEEGQVWEAAMFAAFNKLDNLCVIVDNNGLQIDGKVSEIVGPEPLDTKFEAFGFNVIKVNGHSFNELFNAFNKAKTVKNKPTVIIAKTIKGNGVSFMEDKVSWHGTAPNEEQYNIAINELTAMLSELEGK
ncbi:MAG: transketolase [Hydrogenoanaerobacterium sp.]